MSQPTTDQIRGILQQAEQDAFGLQENGGNAEEIHAIIEDAWSRISEMLGVRHTCFGCGHFRDECICQRWAEMYRNLKDTTVRL